MLRKALDERNPEKFMELWSINDHLNSKYPNSNPKHRDSVHINNSNDLSVIHLGNKAYLRS